MGLIVEGIPFRIKELSGWYIVKGVKVYYIGKSYRPKTRPTLVKGLYESLKAGRWHKEDYDKE